MEKTNNLHSRVYWLVRTAVLIALLISLQWITAGTQAFAGQYITGSLVNCVLALAAVLSGLSSGLVVAFLSPFCARLLGIGPALIQIVPCIAVGNGIYVLVLWLLAGRKTPPLWRSAVGVITGAVGKFLTLYFLVVKLVLPLMGSAVKPPVVAKMTAMFSLPQLITALIGGALALTVIPVLQKAIRK